MVEDSLSAAAIGEGLTTAYLGRSLYYQPCMSSTQDEARRLAEEGAPEGTLVLADYQSAGRGRFERRWYAPPGSSLLLSLLFRPVLAPDRAQRLTMICALGVLDALTALDGDLGRRVGLKWPNDIVCEGRKLGGILTEGSVKGQELEYVVVGLGLNVNLDPGGLPKGLLVPATSLSHALGRPVARRPLLWSLLAAIEGRYERFKSGEEPVGEWGASLQTLGQQVAVRSGDELVEGLAEAVDLDGALLVRQADGRLRRLLVGDVTLRG